MSDLDYAPFPKAEKEKAIYLAGALDEKIGETLTINEPNETSFYPQPVYANRMMKAEAADMGAGNEQMPQIDFKKIKLQFDVNVIFALR